jgi:hypothetical protein
LVKLITFQILMNRLHLDVEELRIVDMKGNLIRHPMCNFKTLKKITLIRTSLAKLPNQIDNLTELEYFNISYNALRTLSNNLHTY